jgi:hypothetical protein
MFRDESLVLLSSALNRVKVLLSVVVTLALVSSEVSRGGGGRGACKLPVGSGRGRGGGGGKAASQFTKVGLDKVVPMMNYKISCCVLLI